MDKAVFIINRKEIDDKKRTLSLISKSEDGLEKIYHDDTTNENWTEFRMEPEYHGGGYSMLVLQPLPNTAQLIQIALDSNNLDEIAGASVFLFTNEEYDKSEFREQLIDALEDFIEQKKAMLNDFDNKKLKTIIHDSGLNDSKNRRDILGKPFKEVESDYKYFKGIADRAKYILNLLNSPK